VVLRVSLDEDLAAKALVLVQQAVHSGFAASLQAGDDTLWGAPAQPEVSVRLGWVHNPSHLTNLVGEILGLRATLISEGIDSFVLCGMGGSSLAPEVMARSSGKDLGILDSTHPDVVYRFIVADLTRTGVIVSSKSGGTLETDSQLRAFEQAFIDQGIDPAARIFVVTDPGSPLEDRARTAGYRTFLGNPNIGGRFSALSAFGLVPAGLAGVDIARIVKDAGGAWSQLGADSSGNQGLLLGAGLASGFPLVNKVLLRSFSNLPGLGDWVEQLVAESTGKDDKGLLPVVDSELDILDSETSDCVSVGDWGSGAQIEIQGTLGEHFLLWQYATAFAGAALGVNPFDQPNVESAKVAARELLESNGSVDTQQEVTLRGGSIWASEQIPDTVASVAEALDWATSLVKAESYLALCVFGDSTKPKQWIALRAGLEKKLNRPVTLGFGPRYLHSTGQFHKGGPAQGVFLTIIEPATRSVAIPGRTFEFGDLVVAQARGDRQVLADTGQPTVSVMFDDSRARDDVVSALLARP